MRLSFLPTLPPRFAIGIVMAICFSGCAVPSMTEPVARSIVANKSPSLRSWKEQSPAALRQMSACYEQTALLIGGWTEFSAQRDGLKMRSISPASWSSAVPIREDGYFLTSAHCVDVPRPLKIVAATSNRGVAVADVRVVWRGRNRLGRADLALIHAPIRPAFRFTLQKADSLPPHSPVASGGWGGMEARSFEAPSRAISAGRLLKVTAPRRDPTGCPYRILKHDVPFVSGDSGGPLVSPDGLIGISSRVFLGPGFLLHFTRYAIGLKPSTIAGYQAIAFAPDPAWLETTIVQDRAQQLAGARPKPAGG
ncbi:MAG: serine protease [Verrucomicrobiota bacterium]